MVALILDDWLLEDLVSQRRSLGIDQRDEVWDGVYLIFRPTNNEHQLLSIRFGSVCVEVVDQSQLGVAFPGVNVTDRDDEWTKNYRCPDVAVYLNGNPAEDRGTHWFGGPDFAVEIVSEGDRSREKLGFYANVNTRELLIIDRDPWRLELYRLEDGELKSAGIATVENAKAVCSTVLPLRMQLISGDRRPLIEIFHATEDRQWEI